MRGEWGGREGGSMGDGENRVIWVETGRGEEPYGEREGYRKGGVL